MFSHLSQGKMSMRNFTTKAVSHFESVKKEICAKRISKLIIFTVSEVISQSCLNRLVARDQYSVWRGFKSRLWQAIYATKKFLIKYFSHGQAAYNSQDPSCVVNGIKIQFINTIVGEKCIKIAVEIAGA